MSEIEAAACLSCSATHSEAFCPRCGEKRITTHDYSVVHFFEHALETFTHFDYRSLRALKLLVFRPGELTRDYLKGRRKAFVGPLQMFVILNVLFAVVGGNTFRTPLYVQERDAPFAGLKRSMVEKQIERRGIEHQELAREFDLNAGVQSKTWIFAMIPAFALILAVLYGFRRYYFEHLVFATHFYAFLLILALAAGLGFVALRRLTGIAFTSTDADNIVSSMILAGLFVYLYAALRRVYDDGRIAATTRALALTLVFFPVLLAYRFLLFFVTLKTMH